MMHTKFAEPLAEDSVVPKARKIFAELWAELADSNGKIEEVDGVKVSIGYKTDVTATSAFRSGTS